MKLLRDIAKFIAWLSGSIAGVGALLYFLGYLVVISHLYRYGIGPLPGYEHRLYLEHGGRFLLDLLNVHLLHVIMFLSLAAILLLGFATLLRGWAGRHRHRLSGLQYGVGRLRERLRTLHGRSLAYGLLLVLFLLMTDQALELLRAPLRGAPLLFAEQPAVPDPDAAHAQFELILAFEMIILVFVLLAARLTRSWRRQALGMAPFVVVGLVCLLLLPVSYGALILDLRHHPVTLEPALEGGPHYLLTATDRMLVIWDRERRKLLWVPQGRLQSVELGAREPMFTPLKVKEGAP